MFMNSPTNENVENEVNVYFLVSVVSRLERSLLGHTDVIGLLLGKDSEDAVKLLQVKAGNLLVQVLGENVHLVLVLLGESVVPELDLSDSLVGERTRHNERRVTSGTTEVEKTALGKHDDGVSILEDELVDLGLDVLTLGDSHKTSHVNLVIEVTDVTNDGVVLHLSHGIHHDDVLVTGSGNVDISLVLNGHVKSHDSETFHSGLKGTDRIDLSDINDASSSLHGLSAPLTDVTETTDGSAFSGKHDISSTHETIGKRVLATVKVIELGLGHRIVDIDSREKELLLLRHDVQLVDTSGGLLGNTDHTVSESAPLVTALGQLTLDDGKNNLELSVVLLLGLRKGPVLLVGDLSLDTLVDEESHISTIVDDHVATVTLLVFGPGDGVEGALPVLLEGLSLPGEDSGRSVASDGSSSVILGGEDVT